MKPDKLARILAYVIAAILVLLPFHALFTTWLGSSFGHLDVFRIWKELLLVPVGLLALWLLSKQPKTYQWLKRTGLLYLILGYIALHLIVGLLALWQHRVNATALIYALLSNLRFVIFFVICLVVSVQSDWLVKHWKQLVLIPAAIVVSFGLTQHFVLAPDFLRHFGYGPTTIPAYQAVDQKSAYARVQSTLRGANPLGAYLVVIIPAFLVLTVTDKKRRSWWGLGAGVSALVLFFTYSRSAYLGALAAVGTLLWRLVTRPQAKKLLLVGAILVVLVGLGGITALRHNDQVQNTFFHTDEHSKSADSSNQDRASALESGLRDVYHHPWGSGPGTAGPASVRNDHPARIAENYYLQIGQEIGLLGLIIFLAINLLVGASLWERRDPLSMALFAGLVGLTLVNMLSHAWGDDTLGMLWWGLAGIALAPSIATRRSRT